MVFLWALSFNQLSLHAAFDLLSTQSKGRRVIKRDDFFSQMSPLLQHHMTSADVAILFKLLDRDNDGEISRIEFFASLHMAKDLNATNQTRRHGCRPLPPLAPNQLHTTLTPCPPIHWFGVLPVVLELLDSLTGVES
mmetsp:Transcript_68919/g.162183  ORF Transcript_68919/g.162183 Transcript_68919/m.162183 type:complete len:137 (+) Transcript_68919:80-490(+)